MKNYHKQNISIIFQTICLSNVLLFVMFMRRICPHVYFVSCFSVVGVPCCQIKNFSDEFTLCLTLIIAPGSHGICTRVRSSGFRWNSINSDIFNLPACVTQKTGSHRYGHVRGLPCGLGIIVVHNCQLRLLWSMAAPCRLR